MLRTRIAAPPALLWLTFLAGIMAGSAAPATAAEGDGAGPRHGIAMHGDLKYPKDFKHFDYVNADAPKGGQVRLAARGTFDSFNPFIIKGVPANIGAIWDTLMLPSADEPFSKYGLIAQTVETPADRSWVEFTLRPEARFHDGKPITPEDVIWSFETLKEKGRPFFRFYYQDVTKVEKKGERGVRFTFKDGTNRELALILGQLPVLPKHWWAGRDFAETTLDPPLGNGAYKLGRFEAGRFLELVRVPDYWAKDLPVQRGLDNFDLRVEYFLDETVLVEALKAGTYDLRAENSAKNWATAYEIDALKRGDLVKKSFRHNRPVGMQGFVMNLRRPLFQDRRVREALILAFDYEWSNTNLFFGTYDRTRSYFDNSELAAEGLPQGEELAILEGFRDKLPPEVFTTEYQPPKSNGSGSDRQLLRRAAELLKEAGWTVGANRKLQKDGKPFAFEILLDSPLFERIATPYVQNLERLGIEAQVRTVDQAQMQRREDSFDYDMIVEVFGASDSPGNEQRDFWNSASADRQGSANKTGLKDPVVDALVEKVIAAPDRKSLVARTRALDRVLQWQMMVVPHWHSKLDRYVYWNIFGQPQITPSQGVQTAAWWVAADLATALQGKRGGRSEPKQ